MPERSKETNEKRFQFWERHLKEWSQTRLSQNAGIPVTANKGTSL